MPHRRATSRICSGDGIWTAMAPSLSGSYEESWDDHRVMPANSASMLVCRGSSLALKNAAIDIRKQRCPSRTEVCRKCTHDGPTNGPIVAAERVVRQPLDMFSETTGIKPFYRGDFARMERVAPIVHEAPVQCAPCRREVR